MKKNLKKLYSFILCITIIAVSSTSLPASVLVATSVSFEDKIIFENDVFSSSEYSLMAENNEEIPESVSVTLRFDESFSCDHENINSDEELTAHRNELKDHYKTLNEKIIDQLELEDYEDMSYSWYGPFIEYNYATYDDFIASDYDTLEDKDSAAMECVYIRSDYEPQNCANVATSTGDSYPFINALRLVEVLGSNNTLSDLDSLQYKGTGIKVGILECWMYKNDANLTGIQHYEYGTITQPIDTQNNDPDDDHAFDVYSVLGGTSGVARGASLYFASTRSYGLFQCINWLVDNGVNVINGSLSFVQTIGEKGYETGSYDSITAYIDYIVNNTKTTYVASAGNSRDHTINTGYLGNPSTGLNVICVASNDRDRRISYFSSYLIPDSNTSRYLLKPTLTAPGGNLSGVDNDITTNLSGTSFSAPIVTGIIALLMEEFPALKTNPQQVMAVLTSSCRTASGQTDVVDADAGFGIVNYARAREILTRQTFTNFTITNSNSSGDILKTITITVPANSVAKCTANILSRSTQTNPNTTLTQSLFLAHSEVRFVITNNSTNVANNGTVKSNFSYFRLNNNTANAVSYTIRLYMISNKAYSGTETGTISCYIPIS